MSVLSIILLTLFSILIFGLAINFLSVLIVNRKEVKLILKSIIQLIPRRASTFSFLVIFFTFLITAVAGNLIAMNNFSGQYNEIIINTNTSFINAYSSTNYIENTDQGNSWNVNFGNPNENSYGDLFIDNASTYFNTDSLYYFTEFINSLNEGNINASGKSYKDNLLFNLEVNLNLAYDFLGNTDLNSKVTSNNYDENKVQIVRVADFDENNSFKNLSGEVEMLNQPINKEVVANQISLLEDNTAFILSSSKQIPLGEEISLYFDYEFKSDPNDKGPYLTKFEPLEDISPIEIVGKVDSSKYLTPSASRASKMGVNDLNTTPFDLGTTSIIFVNEKTFENIFLSLINELRNIDDTTSAIIGTTLAKEKDLVKYLMENDNIYGSKLTFGYSISFLEYYKEIENNFRYYDSFKNDLNEDIYNLNNEMSKYFKLPGTLPESSFLPESSIAIDADFNSYTYSPALYKWDDSSLTINTNITDSIDIYNSYNNLSANISYLLLIVGAIVIFIILFKVVQSNIKPIGTLKSMGFNPSAIAIGYSVYPALALLPSLIAGFFLSGTIVYWWNSLFQKAAIIDFSTVNQNIAAIVLIALFITLFYIMISFLFVLFFTRKKPLNLVKDTSNNKANIIVQSFDKFNTGDKGFKTLYVIKNGFRSISKSFFSFFVILGMSTILIFSLSSSQVVDSSVEKSFQTVNFDSLSFQSSNINKEFVSNEEFEKNIDIISFTEGITENDKKDANTYLQKLIDNMGNIKLEKYSAWPIEEVYEIFDTIDMLASNPVDDPNTTDNEIEIAINNLQSDSKISSPINSKSMLTEFLYKFYVTLDKLIDATEGKNIEYISFNTSTYEKNNQTLAIETVADYAFDSNADGIISADSNASDSEFLGGDMQLTFVDSVNGGQYLTPFDQDDNNLFNKYLSNPDDIETKVNYIGSDGTQNSIVATNALIDSYTAETKKIKKGDVLWIKLGEQVLAPGVDSHYIPIYISDIYVSAVPFGITASVDSPQIKSELEQTTVTSHAIYSFDKLANTIVSKNDNNKKSMTFSISTTIVEESKLSKKENFLPQNFTNSYDFFNYSSLRMSPDSPNYNLTNQQIILPMSLPEQLVKETIEPITEISNVIIVLSVIISVILIGLVINQVINDSLKEATVLQSLGFASTKTSAFTILGYLFIFIIAFIISLPISNAFMGIVTASATLPGTVGNIYFSISISQVLIVLAIIISIFLLSYFIAYLIFSNQNPSKALKQTNN